MEVNIMRLRFKWDSLLMASVVAAAGVCAQSHQFAQAQEQEELEGPIVQIGEAKGDDEAAPAAEAPAAPAFWIGLRGRNVDDPVLRTQLQLAEDMGVVVEDVVAESPAEKADLRKHDIILRANDDVVDSMEVLQNLVVAGGEKPIDLKVLRLGKEIDVTVTPEQRPENFQALMGPETSMPGGEMLGGDLGQLLQQLQGGNLPGGMRVFGPGMVLNGRQFNVDAVPNGISVSIARNGEGPAQITIKKGDKTWTLSSDDAKALAELPEDVRNYVSGMINGENGGIAGQLGNFDWQAELKHQLPDRLGNLPGFDKAFQAQEDEVARRLNEMQQQIEQLQEKLNAAEAEAEAAH
jgi:membrane-associated protease RseP (regulator of RpoE activity)